MSGVSAVMMINGAAVASNTSIYVSAGSQLSIALQSTSGAQSWTVTTATDYLPTNGTVFTPAVTATLSFPIPIGSYVMQLISEVTDGNNAYTSIVKVFVCQGLTSVKLFGAKGDGVTDDSAAFQSATNALANTGIHIWTPAANYKWATNQAIVPNLPSQSVLVMYGRITSTLAATNVFPGAYIYYADAPTQLFSGTLASNVSLYASSLSLTSTTKPNIGQAVMVLHGGSASLYDVVNVSGAASPWTVTTDRPIVYPFTSNDNCFVYGSYPSHIQIDGAEGGSVSGTGDQMFEFARTYRGKLVGLDYDQKNGLVRSAVAGFDTASRECCIEDCVADLTGSTGSTGLTAFYCQSNERTVFRRTRTKNANFVGIDILDSYGCGAEDEFAYGDGVGIAISSLGNVNGQLSLGCYDCYIKGGSAVNCGTGAAVAFVGPAYGSSVDDFSAIGCSSIGISVGAQATATRITNCDVTGSATGLNIVAGANDTQIRGLRGDNCPTNSLAIASDCSLHGMSANCNTSGVAIISINTTAAVRLRDLTLNQAGASGYHIQLSNTGDVKIDGALLTGASAVGLYINAAAKVTIRNVKITAASQGIFVAAGATLTIGEGCDVTGCSSPLTGTGTVQMEQYGSYTDATVTGTVTLNQVQAQAKTIKATGVLTGNITYNVPNNIQGLTYVFDNSTSNGHTASIGVTGGTSITVAAANSAVVWSDGTNMHRATVDAAFT